MSPSDSNLARCLLTHAVSSILAECGNSYVNSYTEQWLRHAAALGAYHGPFVGTLADVSNQWNDWLEANGDLPEWPRGADWPARLG